MFVSVDDSARCFKGFTLIMPAVSVGNVGQLAVDLIVSTLNLQRAGYFHSDSLIPMVGNNPYSNSPEDLLQLSTSAEVYCCKELNLAVLQIRSPIIQTKTRTFRRAVLSWIKGSGFSRTVLLSSSHAFHRDDRQILGSPLRYLLTPALRDEVTPSLETLGWTELEKICVMESDRERLYIPGGGVTKALYTDGCTEGVAMAVMLLFCSEGDNVPDALALASHLNDWLHLLDAPAPWRIPSSWKLLFGSGAPPSIF